MAQALTNKAKYLIASGQLDLDAADIRMGLLKTCANVATSTPDLDDVAAMEAHADFAELTGAAGYARVALTTKTVTEDDVNDRANVDADDVAFGALGAGGTIVGAFLYVYNAGGDASSPLIGIFDLASTPTNGGAVTVNIADWLRIS